MQSYLGLLSGGEDTSTLADIVGSDSPPGDLGRISLSKELNGNLALAIINHKRVGGGIGGNSSGILSMNGIILEHVGGVVQVEEGIVDSHGHDISGVLHGGTADETTDAAESVDSDLDSHGLFV